MFDQDDQDISQIIEAGLDEILSGRASLDDIVSRHPTMAEILRAELESALWLITQREQVRSRPGYIAASRKRLVGRIKQEASNRGAKRAFLGFNWPLRLPAFQWVAAILIVIVFFSISGGVVSAAQESIPGEELYSVKRFSEQVVFDLTSNAAQQVELSKNFTNRRLVEIEALITRREYVLALHTLNELENQVKKTVELLAKVNDNSVAEKLALAENLNLDFTLQADRLEALMAGTPVEMHDELASARDVSTTGALIAQEVSEVIKEKHRLYTLTPEPSLTFTLTRTLTKTNTKTPAPAITATPIIIVVTPAPEESSSDGPELTKTNTPNRRDIKPGLTKTSRPTNENRPDKEDKEPKEEKPPRGNSKEP